MKYITYIRNLYFNLPGDEKLNVLTHSLGLGLTILFWPFLVFSKLDPVAILGVSTFILGAFFMFFSSTFYHLANKDIRKNRWRIVDHISIFILIGCSYTPFVLLYHNTDAGIKFLILHWSIIAGGILFKLIFKTRFEIVSLSLYLVLGWMVVFIYGDITLNMPRGVHNWLIAGGIAYTTGVFFYVKTSLALHHVIWHVFVLAGCICHFIALYLS